MRPSAVATPPPLPPITYSADNIYHLNRHTIMSTASYECPHVAEAAASHPAMRGKELAVTSLPSDKSLSAARDLCWQLASLMNGGAVPEAAFRFTC